MRIGQPLRASVVQIGQGAFLEFFRYVLVAWHRTLGIAGDRLVYPLHPFGRIEPTVAQLDQPPGGLGNSNGVWIVGIVGSRNVGRQPGWKWKRLKGRGRRVTRTVFQGGTKSERPRFVKSAVQDAESRVVVTGR